MGTNRKKKYKYRECGNIRNILILLLLVTISCSDDPVEPDREKIREGKRVLIVNEGNLGYGNASISLYYPDSLQVKNRVFLIKNEFRVGDVPQCLKIRDSLAYLTVSNSGKILVFRTGDFSYAGTIPGLTAPRYLEFISDSQAVVSDLYAKKLSVVNLSRFQKTGEIETGGSTEQIITLGNYLYATSWSFNNKLYKISLDALQLSDSLTTGVQPNSIVSDREGFLWVLCDGGYSGNPAGHEKASLLRIDPVSFKIVRSMEFPDLSTSPSRLSINTNLDTLYFLNGRWGNSDAPTSGVYRLSIEDKELPSYPFIHINEVSFYGLGIDPLNSDIYCTTALDYLRKGRVYRFNSQGFATDSFETGINPGSFAFTGKELR